MARRPRGTEARRGELLEAAGRLFVREGFASVSVSRIVREVGVAQGTFYYYFESKEAVLDALLAAHVQEAAARLAAVARQAGLDPRGALEAMIRTELSFDERRARELGSIRGADAHTKLFAATMRALAPIYGAVIARGVAAGGFRTDHPDLLGETIVLHAHSLFDRDMLGWSEAEYARRRRILAGLVAFLLGLSAGALDFGVHPKTGVLTAATRSGTRSRGGRGSGSGSR
ncbi:MAG TPA: TetR/AcrR family transcriptional regulator [Anaeromyxobacter sp.]|nr:TetR/AcrR family transcriptional regulator [Anaeromyxobacter sp.]